MLDKKPISNFSQPKSLTENVIDIYIDEIFTDESGMEELSEFHDTDNQCMKTIIDSYSIGEMPIGNKLDEGLYLQQLHAELNLKNMDAIKLNIITKYDLSKIKIDKDFILTKCAMESVLKELHKQNCINNDGVFFQFRPANYGFDSDAKISPLNCLIANPKKSIRDEVKISLKKNTVSNTYVYMQERKLCIFLNSAILEQTNFFMRYLQPRSTLNEIQKVLGQLFKEHSLELSNTDNTELNTENSINRQKTI